MDTITIEQAKALRLASRQWKEQLLLIANVEDYRDWSEFTDKLSELVKFNSDVTLSDLYYLVNDLCVTLSDVITYKEKQNGLS